MPTVGVIGLGTMGKPIARHLIAAGFPVVGTDIERGPLEAMAGMGGVAATSSKDVADQADVTLTLLPSAAALRDVVDGLMQATRPGLVVAECSTLPIADKLAARDRLATREITLLDCPLSGTGAQAETRDLVVLGSGPATALERCQPAFAAVSRKQHSLGAFGNGSRMKFVANLLVNIHNVAAAEAMVLGMKAGLDPHMMADVISESAGSSRMFQVRAPMMADGDYTNVSMALSLWRKDIETIAAFAADLHCPVPLFTTAAQPYYAALAQGHGDQDTAAVCAVLEDAARVVRTPARAQ